MCFFFRDSFLLTTIVFAAVFCLVLFLVHVKDQQQSGSKNPGNARVVFFADIIIPLVLWVSHDTGGSNDLTNHTKSGSREQWNVEPG